MTRAEQIAAVLAEHQTEQIWKAGGWAGDTGCSCGWRMGMWDRKDFPPVHRAHVAAALDAALAAQALEPIGAPCVQCGPGYRIGDDGCRHGAAGPRGATQEGERGGAEVAAVEAVLLQADQRPAGEYRGWASTMLVRAALTDPAGALAKVKAEVLRAAADQLRAEGFDAEAVERLEERADRIEAQP